ncbi:MAG TPA: hypothetical protein PKM25_13365 [Candidatus Ozemobacteraceae bacterium]|nr:hypothetical protein [Candidatus Ozemobacteraceae bacterium]
MTQEVITVVLPDTPLYNSKTDAEFRIRMIQEIKEQYQDLLGPKIKLLDLPNGLELVQDWVRNQLFDVSNGEIDMRPAEARQLAA